MAILLALASGAMTFARSARAQNYRELPIGGRTATMGGAGTAAGNDSAMPYLNPAGIAGVPGDIFAVSATVYSYTHRSFTDYFYPNGTQPLLGYQREHESFSTQTFGELPSSVMYFNQPSDPRAHVQHRIGASLVIPGSRQVELVASVSGRLANVAGRALETSSITADQKRYYVGPSYAIGIGRNLRLGASLYAVYRRSVVSTSATSSTSILGGSTTSTSTGQNAQVADALSLAPVLGVQLRVVSDLWLGLGIAPPSIPLDGRLRFTSEASSLTPDETTREPRMRSTTSTADVRFQAVTPLRLNAGVAWDRRDGLSLAADVHFYAGRIDTRSEGTQLFEDRRSGDVTRQYSKPLAGVTRVDAIVDVSAGAELALSEMLALRAGAFTDLAASPELEPRTEDVDRIRLDRFGGTVGVGLKLGSFDTTAGVVVAHGVGRFGARDSWITGGVVPVRTTETTSMFVLSGAVTVAEAKKTIRDTLPVSTPPLPDLDVKGPVQVPAPWIPTPLPPEPRPPPPPLRTASPPAEEPPPPSPSPSPSP